MKFTTTMSLAAACVLALGLSACGSNSLTGDPATSDGPSVAVSENADLSAKLPESIKSSGVIRVGSGTNYPPSEFLAPDGKTIQGFDIDVFDAVAAKLGVKAEFQSAEFASIIAGVNAKKWDVGVSSFTVTDARMKEANMVSYFNAGSQWASKKGNPKGIDPDNACGKTIAVQTGTVQAIDDLPARQKKCGSDKINILSYKDQGQATAAVVGGKADAMLADSPVVAYATKQTNGKLETLGDIYEAAPYGYVLAKADTDFADAIAEALKGIKEDGAYEAALKKWGVEQGAIDNFAVNP